MRGKMKKGLHFFIVIYLVLILVGCVSQKPTQKPEAAVVNKIKPEAAKELLEGENPPTLVDEREPNEFSDGHIPNAINIPLGDVVNGVNQAGLAKDAPIMVYCRSGARSADAARKLINAGYTQIYDLGGIINWPYETVK